MSYIMTQELDDKLEYIIPLKNNKRIVFKGYSTNQQMLSNHYRDEVDDNYFFLKVNLEELTDEFNTDYFTNWNYIYKDVLKSEYNNFLYNFNEVLKLLEVSINDVDFTEYIGWQSFIIQEDEKVVNDGSIYVTGSGSTKFVTSDLDKITKKLSRVTETKKSKDDYIKEKVGRY